MARPLVLTRPLPQSERAAREIEAICPGKFDVLISPLLEIRPEPGSVDVEGAQALLFSSANAVREFARRSPDRNLPAICVGDATAGEAAAAGFSAMSAGRDASALTALAAQTHIPDFGPMIHFRGSISTGDVAGALMAEGIDAEERILYDQVAVPLTPEARTALARKDAVTAVFSPRTAALLAAELADIGAGAITIVAISANAAAPLSALPNLLLHEAPMPELKAIVQILADI